MAERAHHLRISTRTIQRVFRESACPADENRATKRRGTRSLQVTTSYHDTAIATPRPLRPIVGDRLRVVPCRR